MPVPVSFTGKLRVTGKFRVRGYSPPAGGAGLGGRPGGGHGGPGHGRAAQSPTRKIYYVKWKWKKRLKTCVRGGKVEPIIKIEHDILAVTAE